MRWKKVPVFLALAAAALLAAACSLGRLAYNNATPVVTYIADDYFDLNGSQEDLFRQRFTRAMAWHRTTELPEYERFLRDALARTERTITVEDARWASTGLRNYYHRMVEHVLPDMADLIHELDAEQARHFEERFAKESAKIARETVKGSAEAREANRVKKMIAQIETYTGRLSPDQRELVTARVHFMVDVSAMRIEDRRRRQALIANLVKSKPSKPELTAGLRRLLIETDTWRKPDYGAALKQREEQVCELAVVVAASLTPDQRTHVRKKLRSYLQDVSSLMASR